MYRVVKIGDKEVPMLSLASVDLFYRQIFHKDAQKIQSAEDFGGVESLSFVFEIGFIMAKRAEGLTRQQMAQLTEDDFDEWLDSVDRGGIYDAVADIWAVYNGQQAATSDAKKNGDS